jgi:PPOX class probable FMN-dependent enzyme
MKFIETLEDLHSLYGEPSPPALVKVANGLTDEYRAWIFRSRFCILSTVGPEGTDATPRGDAGPVVAEIDARTIAMPDWRGNNRLDSLRNIVRDPRVSLMFMVPGANNVIRLNGEAKLTADPDLAARFERKNILPGTVIVIKIKEIYTQCARAFVRSQLWTGGDDTADLPTMGQILSAMSDGQVGGETYDNAWSDRAAKTMW